MTIQKSCFAQYVGPSLQRRWQMLDAALQRMVVCFAHDYVDVATIVLDERPPHRREISGWRVVTLPFYRWQENERLAGLQAWSHTRVVFPAPHR